MRDHEKPEIIIEVQRLRPKIDIETQRLRPGVETRD